MWRCTTSPSSPRRTNGPILSSSSTTSTRSGTYSAGSTTACSCPCSDYNTLTFLFHQPVASLQVQTPEGQWRYGRSRPEAVVVNIADALEFFSGGYLKSTIHRVVRRPPDQADRPRLSLIYFARPEANVTLKPVSSPLLQQLGLQSQTETFTHDVTAEEWARARIAKDHKFRVGEVATREGEIIAGVRQKCYA
ncbi:2OG-Fe(II) oxygenase superfamily protein [Apiospora phragmitis]|uniref:2OG-Fe(II) oxygenase superfamily protein n=1 Tax=Apiospora phragmitis TaxID=2905665 RepID=A0ABR1VPW0_9PEZI